MALTILDNELGGGLKCHEKGMKPEASARRLDVTGYDSREAWGWLSEDERLIMSKEGVAYVDVELVCLKFDEFLKELTSPFTD